jgi:gamma-glutamylcyclotransferase (GGCT)/AIG2-like uncharacterized protein YtfP
MQKNINSDYVIKVFVFGTLRSGGRLDYYMDGSKFSGRYYIRGQLMKSEIGSAYIDFEQPNAYTLGELYEMNYAGLQRIDHLESTSGEFPKGYDLSIEPIWEITGDEFDFNEQNKTYAFVYKRRNKPQKIISGDWINRKKPVREIKQFLEESNPQDVNADNLILYMKNYLDE